MGVSYRSKINFDQIHEEALHRTKIAEPYTLTNMRERIIWQNVIYFAFLHAGLVATVIVYGFGLHSVPMKWATIFWAIGHGHFPAVGITAGAHRLWTHRAYKAKLPLRIMLMIIYCMAGINSIFHWVKDHRVHHKYSETNADPHNAKRGFLFSHMGWLMLKRHPEYLRRGKEIDMSDIIADPVVMFQKKHSSILNLIFCFIIPCAIPVIFWGETLMHAVLTQYFLRHVLTLHFIWSVNSVAHLWGDRPYNRFINPVENIFVSIVTAGEGSHNYHHTFPWDYKASELPYFNFNTTTLFIDVMAKIGWAYDLRKPSPEFVNKVIQQIGHKSEGDIVS